MRFLFVMDSLKRLDLKWDTSLFILKELNRRDHKTWVADSTDLSAEGKGAFARATQIRSFENRIDSLRAERRDLSEFHCILIRKDPPVDAQYLYFIELLETISSRVPIANDPRGIRNTNEKLSILNFPEWIPKTFVSSSPQGILEFQKRCRRPIVVKPLDQKGGHGIFLLPLRSSNAVSRLIRATKRGAQTLMAQEFIRAKRQGEKRIILLNGKVLTVYEKKSKPHEFRANLGLGARWMPASLSAREKKLVRAVKPYLIREKL